MIEAHCEGLKPWVANNETAEYVLPYSCQQDMGAVMFAAKCHIDEVTHA